MDFSTTVSEPVVFGFWEHQYDILNCNVFYISNYLQICQKSRLIPFHGLVLFYKIAVFIAETASLFEVICVVVVARSLEGRGNNRLQFFIFWHQFLVYTLCNIHTCGIKFCCRGFDDEMRAVVARNLEGRGINLHPRTTLTQVFPFEVCNSDLWWANSLKM